MELLGGEDADGGQPGAVGHHRAGRGSEHAAGGPAGAENQLALLREAEIAAGPRGHAVQLRSEEREKVQSPAPQTLSFVYQVLSKVTYS